MLNVTVMLYYVVDICRIKPQIQSFSVCLLLLWELVGHVSTCSWWLVWSVCLSYCWILANSVLLLCCQQSAVSRGLCLLCLAAALSKLSHFLWSHRPNRTETPLLIRLFVCTCSCQLWATSFVTSVLSETMLCVDHSPRPAWLTVARRPGSSPPHLSPGYTVQDVMMPPSPPQSCWALGCSVSPSVVAGCNSGTADVVMYYLFVFKSLGLSFSIYSSSIDMDKNDMLNIIESFLYQVMGVRGGQQ